ncbi:hypothetical protein GCM10008941_37560 [Rhizomicrobium palustre]
MLVARVPPPRAAASPPILQRDCDSLRNESDYRESAISFVCMRIMVINNIGSAIIREALVENDSLFHRAAQIEASNT